MRPKMLIFGFGYTANFLATKLAALDFHVVGTSRNQDFLGQHNEKGYELRLCFLAHKMSSLGWLVRNRGILGGITNTIILRLHHAQ